MNKKTRDTIFFVLVKNVEVLRLIEQEVAQGGLSATDVFAKMKEQERKLNLTIINEIDPDILSQDEKLQAEQYAKECTLANTLPNHPSALDGQ